MITHLALLRGINVSGHKMINMAALKKALEAIGFTNVVTYIQSGNVFVNTDEENPSKVGFLIKQEIFKEFGHDVPVIVIGREDLQACLDRNEFLNDEGVDLKKLYVSFISSVLPDNIITLVSNIYSMIGSIKIKACYVIKTSYISHTICGTSNPCRTCKC